MPHARSRWQPDITPSVKVAYIVISHRSPAQVLRLVSALREGPGVEVVVRHAQDQSRLDRETVEAAGAHLLEDDFEVGWGDIANVRMVLGALEWAMEHVGPDWLFVLSGQDYPLRPLRDFEASLARADHDAFIRSMWQLDTTRLPGPPHDEFFLRYAYRHVSAPGWMPHPPDRLRALVYRRELPPLIGVRRRRLPFDRDFRCFVSADWLTVSSRAAEALVDARSNRSLMSYYARTAIPTESFFATVLGNANGLRVAPDEHRFISFPGPRAPHPDILTVGDLDRLIDSGRHFGRKFDADLDSEVLDRLDEHRAAQSPR
jgi:hypothetical protein